MEIAGSPLSGGCKSSVCCSLARSLSHTPPKGLDSPALVKLVGAVTAVTITAQPAPSLFPASMCRDLPADKRSSSDSDSHGIAFCRRVRILRHSVARQTSDLPPPLRVAPAISIYFPEKTEFYATPDAGRDCGAGRVFLPVAGSLGAQKGMHKNLCIPIVFLHASSAFLKRYVTPPPSAAEGFFEFPPPAPD